DESFCGCNRFVRAPAVEKRHSQAMQGILVVGIDLQGLFIGFDGLVELVITERVNRGLEVFFLRHVWILYRITGDKMNFLPLNVTAGYIPLPAAGVAKGAGRDEISCSGFPRSASAIARSIIRMTAGTPLILQKCGAHRGISP